MVILPWSHTLRPSECPREEAEHELVELGRPLELRQVGGAGNRLVARARDLPEELLCDVVYVLDVVLADEHEPRAGDLAETGGEVGDERLLLHALEHGQPVRDRLAEHLGHEAPDSRIDVLHVPAGTGEPRAEVRVDGGVDVATAERIPSSRWKARTAPDHS